MPDDDGKSKRNYIGTNAAGTAAVGNGFAGVYTGAGSAFSPPVSGTATNTIIGGTTVAERNIISGNRSHGITIAGTSASGNQVFGNFIGTAADGTSAIPNLSNGITINNAPNNIIGGTAAGVGNRIAL